MYAQKIEGDSWAGEKLDQGKIEKMSGMDFPEQDTVPGVKNLRADSL